MYRIDPRQSPQRGSIPWQPHRSWSKRPAVAVLPFRNMSGNAEERYFSEGITEDIIGGLSRSHALHVISWSSTLRYRDRQMGAGEIATELGVRYLLEGGVRRRAARLRISSELTDAANSRTIWADGFDGVETEIFEFQDRIASSIVATIEPKLYQAAAARASQSRPTASMPTTACSARCRSSTAPDDSQFAEAGEYFRRSVTLDPF